MNNMEKKNWFILMTKENQKEVADYFIGTQNKHIERIATPGHEEYFRDAIRNNVGSYIGFDKDGYFKYGLSKKDVELNGYVEVNCIKNVIIK